MKEKNRELEVKALEILEKSFIEAEYDIIDPLQRQAVRGVIYDLLVRIKELSTQTGKNIEELEIVKVNYNNLLEKRTQQRDEAGELLTLTMRMIFRAIGEVKHRYGPRRTEEVLMRVNKLLEQFEK